MPRQPTILSTTRPGTKRHRLIAPLIALHFLLAGSTRAQEASPQLDESIRRGLAFLAAQQNPDGSIDGGGPKLATTGLSLMAFLAAGHAPDAGPFGLTVRQAVDFLLAQTPQDGYYGKIDHSRMYGHGIVTLALIEAWGVEPEPERRRIMRQAIQHAIQVILDAQAVTKTPPWVGGWRYEPQSPDSDLSLSGWNALALRAAQKAGLDVPQERAQQALGFVLRCYRPTEKGFAYQPGQPASAAMTAVALLNLYLLDTAPAVLSSPASAPASSYAQHPELAQAAQFLRDHPLTEEVRFFYYACHYVAQAAHQVGEPTWPAVWNPLQQRLLALQQPDGGWPPSRTGEEPGRVYSTSLATLTLSVPFRLLPIYQR